MIDSKEVCFFYVIFYVAASKLMVGEIANSCGRFLFCESKSDEYRYYLILFVCITVNTKSIIFTSNVV